VALNSMVALESLSDGVNWSFTNNKNYLIKYSKTPKSTVPYCIIYFSSNFVYQPNTKEAFYDQIIKKDRYEWFHTRIDCGAKHIFIRDIKKRHYLTGINSDLDTIEKVIDFLKSETDGYRVITVGSSSGGFGAVFFGQKLNAERIYCFNGQFVLDYRCTFFWSETERALAKKYSNISDYLKTPSTVFYFSSNKSIGDIRQFKYVENTGINILSFNTSVHGVPFLKNNLPVVLNLKIYELKAIANKRYNPIFFSIQMVGITGLLIGICRQTQELLHEHNLINTIKSSLH
jgi:hypothetical protein